MSEELVPYNTAAREVAPRAPQALAPSGIDEMWHFAELVTNSELVPVMYRGKPQNAFVAVQLGAEIGLKPMQSLQHIAVVNGKPSLYGDAAIAICRTKTDWDEAGYEEGCVTVSGMLVGFCQVQRKGGKVHRQEFSELDAKTAKLWGKVGPWQATPKRMLQLRARAFALRNVFAHHLLGLPIYEEMQDIEAEYTIEPAGPEPAKKAERVRAKLRRNLSPTLDGDALRPAGEPAIHPAQSGDGGELYTDATFVDEEQHQAPERAPLTKRQQVAMWLGKCGMKDPVDYRLYASRFVGRAEPIASVGELTDEELEYAVEMARFAAGRFDDSKEVRAMLVQAESLGLELSNVEAILTATDTYVEALGKSKRGKRRADPTPGEVSEALYAPAPDA